MKMRYSLIPVCMALCIVCGVVTGSPPGILSDTPASGTELAGKAVISRPDELSLAKYEINGAISPAPPGMVQPVIPVPSSGVPVSGQCVWFHDILTPGQSPLLSRTLPGPGTTLPYPPLLVPVNDPGTGSGQPYSRPVNGTGTIRWIDLEGGFYGIESDDGARYLPLNLGEAYQVEGLRIRFQAFPARSMTIAMWGIPVTLVFVAEENGESTGIWLIYHRTGGIAGFRDDLTVYGNGSAKISRKGEIRNIWLTCTEIDAVRDAGDEAGFPNLSREYLPDGGGCDLFFYEISWEGKTVLTADTAIPEELMPLIRLSNEIVARVSPR
jgi:hypothetical protein